MNDSKINFTQTSIPHLEQFTFNNSKVHQATYDQGKSPVLSAQQCYSEYMCNCTTPLIGDPVPPQYVFFLVVFCFFTVTSLGFIYASETTFSGQLWSPKLWSTTWGLDKKHWCVAECHSKLLLSYSMNSRCFCFDHFENGAKETNKQWKLAAYTLLSVWNHSFGHICLAPKSALKLFVCPLDYAKGCIGEIQATEQVYLLYSPKLSVDNDLFSLQICMGLLTYCLQLSGWPSGIFSREGLLVFKWRHGFKSHSWQYFLPKCKKIYLMGKITLQLWGSR